MSIAACFRSKSGIAVGMVLMLAGCASTVPEERLKNSAVIIEGSTNAWLAVKFGPTISVVEIDGKPVENGYGPFDLEPGSHVVKMKCGKTTNDVSINVVAGEVYEFGYGPRAQGCEGGLLRTRRARKQGS